MQRLLGLAREVAIDGDEVTRAGDLAGDDDLILAQARLERKLGRVHRGDHHALVQDLLGGPPETAVGVLLHLRHDELLVERAAIDADAHRLVVIDGDLADRGELLVAATARTDVARIDPVLVERCGAGWMPRQQQVAVVMKVADERRQASGVAHAPLDFGNRRRGLGKVHCHAHELGPRFGQLDALPGGGLRIRGVRHGHRLDEDGSASADHEVPDLDPDGLVEADCCGHRINHKGGRQLPPQP